MAVLRADLERGSRTEKRIKPGEWRDCNNIEVDCAAGKCTLKINGSGVLKDARVCGTIPTGLCCFFPGRASIAATPGDELNGISPTPKSLWGTLFTISTM